MVNTKFCICLGPGRTRLTKFVWPYKKSRQNLSLRNFLFVKRGRTETQQNVTHMCQSHETRASIATFEDFSDLSNIAGVIDGTHIKIKAPKRKRCRLL